ncbi:hypothetical protein ACVWXL_005381 [Bradyrhizobium sp. GM22.5]
MRSFFIAFTSLMLLSAGAAQAKVDITVDKDNQQMTVAVDGVARYHWPVSTGIPSRETPNGAFRAFRMEEDHYSKEFDDAPMPHAIFFTKVGHAIHGTDSVGRLGTPASHGCVRLSRQNATTLYALVQQQGVLNHHGNADRLGAGGARPQSAWPQSHGSGPRAAARRRAVRHIRRSREPDASGRTCPPLHAARRQLHLSGRRQRHRRALPRAARQPPAL